MKKSFFMNRPAIKKKLKKARKRTSFSCRTCKLDRGCMSPRMEPHGENQMNIAVVAEAPGKTEDERGIQLIGKSGQFLRRSLEKNGVALDKDCIKQNIIQCRPPGNRPPTPEEIQCCRPRLESQLARIKPDLIFVFGTPAISEILRTAPFSPTATNMHGRVIPSPRWKAWVCCGMHPAWYLREGGRFDGRMDEVIEAGLKVLGERGPYYDQRLDGDKYEVVETLAGVEELFEIIGGGDPGWGDEVSFDYETTCLNPYSPSAKFLSVSFARDKSTAWFLPLEHPHARWKSGEIEIVYDYLRKWLPSDRPKVVQNWAFEDIWSAVKLGVRVNNVKACTMVRQHVIDNRQGVTGQEFQEFVRYGESEHKVMINKENLSHEFLDRVARYNTLDVRYNIRIYHDQSAEMNADLRRAYELFHEAIPVFTTMRLRGIKLDSNKLDRIEQKVTKQMGELREAQEADCLAEYKGMYGKAWDSKSTQAKQRLFFGILELEPLKLTAKGGNIDDPTHCSTDIESMEHLLTQVEDDSPVAALVRSCLGGSLLTKLHGYIKGYRKLVDKDSMLHPSFNLHGVSSYRSSSSDPNFQNIPVRKPRLAVLRKCLVPQHEGFLEIDFSGAEVRGYAVHSEDKRLIKDIKKGVDMHLRYAAILYEKMESEVSKEERYNGKNQFVFPEFYGSYYETIAQKNPQWRLETVREAERVLWQDYKDLRAWQQKSERFYHDKGFLQYLTGFRVSFGKGGMLGKNQICNMPNQGFAFHRLVKVLLELEKWMRKQKMVSWICGQIHDSIVIDYVDSEVDIIIKQAERIVKRPAWDFDTVVPWEAEFKVGANLLDFEEV